MQTLCLLHIVQQWNSWREKKLKEMDQNNNKKKQCKVGVKLM